MYLDKIKIKNYKNLKNIELSISPKINCLIGKNGAGKTNFLDTVYFLSNTRSYFNRTDSKNINYNSDYFYIEGDLKKEDDINTISGAFSSKKGKKFKLDGNIYKKLSEHYGKFPVVIITPYDINIILEGSEIRRNFIDSIISQYNKKFLQNLIDYKKILNQRNSLLKKFAENKTFDANMIEMFDYKLTKLNPLIYEERKNFVKDFIPIFKNYYHKISGSNENIDIKYKTQLKVNNFGKLLSENLKKDLILQRTTVGIHKDDLNFTIDANALKKNGSQGQQKTFLTALKFAQSDFTKKHTNICPILLLDDIFDKLDASRVENVVKIVSNNNFGQIFITHTDNDKLKNILKPANVNYSIYEVEKGKIKTKK